MLDQLHYIEEKRMPVVSSDALRYLERAMMQLGMVESEVKRSETLTEQDMNALEGLYIIAYLVWNDKEKLHQAHRRMRGSNHLPSDLINPPFILDYPRFIEERMNRLKIAVVIPEELGEGRLELVDVSLHPELMALGKATRTMDHMLGDFGSTEPDDYPRNGSIEHVMKIMEYLQFAWMVGKEERGDRKHLQPAFDLNKVGMFVPSIGHDIVTYRRDGNDLTALHQVKHIRTKEEYVSHLTRLFGIDKQISEKTAEIHFFVRDAIAVHELVSDIAGVVRREQPLVYDRVSYDLLLCYVYGLQAVDENNPTRKEIEKLWQLYGQTHTSLFKGWNPKSGIKLEEGIRTNGGVPNQSPIFWVGRSELKALIDTSDKEALLESNQLLIDMVSGNPSGLPTLLRALTQTVLDDSRRELLLASPESQWYKAVGETLQAKFQHPHDGGLAVSRVIPEHVIDFTETLSQYVPTKEYLESLAQMLPVSRND